MTIKQTRKTPEEIKEEILLHLKRGPLSTINSYLEELKDRGDVREIYSRENLKIYIRADYPVFYGLPLDEDKLKESLFLLSKIIGRWKIVNGSTITKTPLFQQSHYLKPLSLILLLFSLSSQLSPYLPRSVSDPRSDDYEQELSYLQSS